jgi:hypothetical protein
MKRMAALVGALGAMAMIAVRPRTPRGSVRRLELRGRLTPAMARR